MQCRTCLKTSTGVYSLTSSHIICNKVILLIDLLKTCTDAKIDVNDEYPQQICFKCANQAEAAYEFRVQCEKSDESLRSVEQTIEDDSKIMEISFEEKSYEDYSDFETQQDVKEEIIFEQYACVVCNLIFPTEAGLTRHSYLHEQVFYECAECKSRFLSEDLLHNHIESAHSTGSSFVTKKKKQKQFSCEICSKKFVSEIKLRDHLKRHATEENIEFLDMEYQCKLCSEKFNTLIDYESHLKTHEFVNIEDHEEEEIVVKTSSFSCRFCEESFENENDLDDHMQNHIVRKDDDINDSKQKKILYKCRLCPDESSSIGDMKTHLENHNIPGYLIFKHLFYKCWDCELEFSSIYDCYDHVGTHKKGSVENCSDGDVRLVRKRPYKCVVQGCNKTFPNPSSLKSHARSHKSRWPKKCRHCGETINNYNDYITHMNENHEDKKTFICSQCGKKFFMERNLERHAKTHSGERNYMCDICGFSFHAHNNLVAHRRIHTGVKPYKCTYCSKEFSQHAGLRSHLINHTGERNHECNICNRKFLRIGSLKSHLKTHTGAKDYSCHICGARFGASSTRKKHLLTHTGERNHICDFCGKAFSRNSNLNVHRKIHTGEASHVCEICGRGFIQAHVLRTHMKTHRKRSALENNGSDIKEPQTVLENQVIIEQAE